METKEIPVNKWKYYLIIFGLVMIIISLLTCKGNSGTDSIKVTATSGKTPVTKPKQEPIVIVKDSIILKYIPASNKDYTFWKSEAERMQAERNEKALMFENASDSIKKLLYAQEIQPEEYFNEWDNDTINAKVFGMKTGVINSMQLKYTVKERNQQLKIPKTVFRLLGGIETGTTTKLSKFNIKANLGFQNEQGNIFSAGFDSEQRIYLGYTASIFQIKK